MKWLQKASIKTKMILAFFGVSLLSVLLMNAFTQYFYGKEVKNDFLRISQEAADRLNHHMEYYFKQLQQSASSLIQSDLVQLWLEEPEHDDLVLESTLEKELRKYLGMNHSEIVDLFLVAPDGRVIAGNGLSRGAAAYTQEPWYGMKLEPGYQVLSSHWSNYPQSGWRQVLSLLIPVYSKDHLGLIGRVVIDITLQEISGTFANTGPGMTGSYFITDSDQIVVYHPRMDWIGMRKEETGLSSLNLTKRGSASVQEWQGDKQLVAVVLSQSTGWNIVATVPYREMASGLLAARQSSLFAMLVIVAAILLVVPLLSEAFVQPIRMLKRNMELVSYGRLEVQSTIIPGADEFQHLNRSFNLMVQRLNELMTTVTDLKLQEANYSLMQKDAVISALQNQINPHLLYNSLDIIRSMAYLEKNEAVIIMAKSLAEIYRYTAKIDRKEVTLQDELEALKKYLTIIHIRFPSHFQSRITVHDKFLEQSVVKLTLQPLVENAVKYAVEPKGGHAAIIVSAYDEGGDLLIEIADNGPGIAPERMAELQLKLEALSRGPQTHYAKQEALGIANVHARLILKYGAGYGLTVASFPGRGTVVTVRLPREKRKIG